MGPARCGYGAEGPSDGAEWAGRPVRSERRPGALLESARSLALFPMEGEPVYLQYCT